MKRPSGSACPPRPSLAAQPTERLLTLEDLAAEAQVSVRTLQREIAAGRLRCLHLGRQVRFRRRDVEAWLTRAYAE